MTEMSLEMRTMIKAITNEAVKTSANVLEPYVLKMQNTLIKLSESNEFLYKIIIFMVLLLLLIIGYKIYKMYYSNKEKRIDENDFDEKYNF